MGLLTEGGGKIILLNRFKVLKKLGEGRFGNVYLVRDTRNGKTYALKEARDQLFLNQLLNEAQNMLLIDHPHLVKLHQYFISRRGRKIYILYEYCDGGDLKGYVEKKGGKLTVEEALRILKQVAQGLSYLHRLGYIHLDIKPENVLAKFKERKRIWKLGDFGLIKPRGYSGILDVKGTRGYIAPEVFRGEIHRSSDIFSLGCLFYYMLTGRHPFKAETPAEELKRNKEGKIHPPEGLPPELKEIFSKMVKINPFQRYRTADQLLTHLKKIGVLRDDELSNSHQYEHRGQTKF